MRRRVLLGAMIVVASGCAHARTTTPPDSQHELPGPSDRDGTIDFSEYQSAVFAFKDCVAGSGYEIINLSLDPVSQVYSYAIPNAAVQSGVADVCYDDLLANIDEQWQTVFGPSARASDSTRRASVVACLMELGVDRLPNEASISEALRLADQQGLDPTSCLSPSQN